jgi:hypothetical protein
MTKEEALNYRVDKSTWPDGPWMSEPDRVDFHHVGLPCLLLRHWELGNWTCYVGVPPGHPLYGLNYQQLQGRVDAPRSICYSNKCFGTICHVPAPGESDDIWWFGFDFAHASDLVPALLCITPGLLKYQRYVPLEEARAALAELAQQVAIITTPLPPVGVLRLAIRGFADGEVVFEERVAKTLDDLDTLVPELAAQHAAQMAGHQLHMIEIEFLDEPDPNERFFRLGTDPRGMVDPIQIDLTEATD